MFYKVPLVIKKKSGRSRDEAVCKIWVEFVRHWGAHGEGRLFWSSLKVTPHAASTRSNERAEKSQFASLLKSQGKFMG